MFIFEKKEIISETLLEKDEMAPGKTQPSELGGPLRFLSAPKQERESAQKRLVFNSRPDRQQHTRRTNQQQQTKKACSSAQLTTPTPLPLSL
jgi:hypothetical protein